MLEPTDATAAERHGFVDAPALEPVFDYSYDAVLRSVDASRARLRRERIDILFAHDLGAMVHGDEAPRHLADFLDGGYRALRGLRDAGEVKAIGIGVNEVEVCLDLLDRVELDVILLAGRYTLLEQDGAAALIERCRASGTRLVIGGPYNSGILVEGSRSARHFNYAPPPASIVARVAELERICADFDVPLAAAALQFPTREPVVAGVIPGLVGTDQVAATLRYAECPIPPALWDAVRSAEAPR